MRWAVLALVLLLSPRAALAAESFCTCATDAGTSVGAFKNAECEGLGIPKAAGEDLDCDDAERSEYVALTGTNSLTDDSYYGQTGCRGNGSLLGDRYGNTPAGCGWSASQPASPTYGSACRSDPGVCGGECEPAVWLEGNPLQVPANFCWAMFTSGVADDIFDGATTPAAPLAGNRSLALVVQAGQTNGKWDGGTTPLSFHEHTFAISKLLAYPSNLASTGILAFPWKGDQCGPNAHCVESWLGGDTNQFPFQGPIIYSLDNCPAAIAGATYVVGTSSDVDCGGGGTNFRVLRPTNYSRSTDWPYGTTGLLQVFYRAMGTSTSEVKVMFTAAGGTRKTVFHVQNLDTRGYETMVPYAPNPFANANQGLGETPTTLDTGRVWDNLLIQSWTSGTAPADVTAAMFTPAQMQLAVGGASPTISISGVAASDSTPAFNTAINVTITFSATDTSGTLTAAVDCENDGGYEDGSQAGASPITVTGVCPYGSAGSKTIGVRVQDTGPTASDTDTVAVTVEAATLSITGVTPSPSSGVAPVNDVDLTFLVSGTATGNVTLEADCDNSGGYEVSAVDTASPWALVDACDYASGGTKTIPVRATRSGTAATSSTSVTVSDAPVSAPAAPACY